MKSYTLKHVRYLTMGKTILAMLIVAIKVNTLLSKNNNINNNLWTGGCCSSTQKTISTTTVATKQD